LVAIEYGGNSVQPLVFGFTRQGGGTEPECGDDTKRLYARSKSSVL